MPKLIAKRYFLNDIQEHIASQYVLGNLSYLARNRVEKLAKQIPEISQYIQFWQERLEDMNHQHKVQPPEKVWQSLQAMFNEEHTIKNQKNNFFHSLMFWRFSSVTLMVMLSLGAFILNPAHKSDVVLGYTASMHAPNSTQTLFVLNVYKDKTSGVNQMKLLKNQRANQNEIEGFVWVKRIGSLEFERLGQLRDVLAQDKLTKQQWTLIKDSHELIVTKDSSTPNDIWFKGLCVQLTSWI